MKLGQGNIVLWLIIIIIPVTVKCHPSVSQKELDISQGYGPDSATAVQIAQILFVRVYGEKALDKKPFVATLKDGAIWVVGGSVDGGVPHIEIQKSDGMVVNLYHYK